MDPPPQPSTPSSAAEPPPPAAAAVPPPTAVPPPASPQPPPSSASAATAATTGVVVPTSDPPNPIPPQTLAPRPPLPRSRPPSPYPSATSGPAGVSMGVPAHQLSRPPQPPLNLSTFGSAPSFTQPFTPLIRSAGGAPEPSPGSSAQARHPVAGVHSIGMFGSLSSGSQIRPSGIPMQHPQRPSHSTFRSPSVHQSSSAQIDPFEKLDPSVEDVLVEIADDFVGSITKFACSLAKHRKSKTVEAKDILLHVERNWNLTLPGFGGDEIKLYKKQSTNDIHKERLAAVKKSMTSDAAYGKNTLSGQTPGSAKTYAGKAPMTAGQSERAP